MTRRICFTCSVALLVACGSTDGTSSKTGGEGGAEAGGSTAAGGSADAGGSTGVSDAPVVAAVTPAKDATGVERDAPLTVQFDGDLDASTVNTDTVKLSCGGEAVAAEVRYDAETRTIVVTPSAPLPLAACELTVSTSVKSRGGAALAEEVRSAFQVRNCQWGTPTRLGPTPKATASDARIAADNAGNVLAVWSQGDLWRSWFTPGEGWGLPEPLEANSGVPSAPVLHMDDAGGATVYWYQGDLLTPDFHTAQYSPKRGWGPSSPSGLPFVGDRNYVSLAAGPNGGAVAIWADRVSVYRDALRSRRFVPGSGWGLQEEMGDCAELGCRGPAAATDGAGNTIHLQLRLTQAMEPLALSSVEGDGWGAWTPIGWVTTEKQWAWGTPDVSMTAQGNGFAVWTSTTTQHARIVGRAYDVDGGWGGIELLQGEGLPDSYSPKVALNATGNGVVAWFQLDDGHWSVWAAYRDALGTWSEPHALESVDTGGRGPGGYEEKLAVAIDDFGNATVLWNESDGVRTNLWANRYVPGTGWGADTLVETAPESVTSAPQFTTDGLGNAIAIWTVADGDFAAVWSNRCE